MPSNIILMTDDILDRVLDVQDSLVDSVELARKRIDELDQRDYEAFLARQAPAHDEVLIEEARMHEHQMRQIPGFTW